MGDGPYKKAEVVAKTKYGNIYPAPNDKGYRIFRPDGNEFVLGYLSPLTIDQIKWIDKKPAHSYTTSRTRYFLDTNMKETDEYNAPQFANVPKNDLKIVGYTEGAFRDPVYAIANENNPILKKEYADYKKRIEQYNKYVDVKEPTEKWEDYVKSLPMFFWKDPFGRFIQFTNTKYLHKSGIEPIIYLYPKSETRITVSIEPPMQVVTSWPRATHDKQNGWQVSAKSTGELSVFESPKTYPYLFWEGHSFGLPDPDIGNIVSREQMETFLTTHLNSFGLNDREKEDFLTYWLPQLKSHPFYLIYFFDRNDLDRAAPLSISPIPETLIRVWINYIPLQKPIGLPKQSLPTFKTERKGFTVVEWGGILRD